ncbi:MAG: thermonuclease family protein, partial [Actinomycetota bacterium]
MERRCPTCLTELDEARESTFCPSCGSSLATPASAAACASCGRPLLTGAHFCDGCGHPVGTAAEPETVAVPLVPAPPTADLSRPKKGIAGIVRSQPWYIVALIVVFLLPFWLTSEIRRTSWPTGGKGAAIGGVWLLMVGTAGAASAPPPPAPSDAPAPTETALVQETAEPTAEPSPFRAAPTGWPTPPSDALEARVVSVTDGDTIVLSGINVGTTHSAGGRRARLIGIDTPEVFGGAECYGSEASAFTKRELAKRTVLVEFDVQTVDRYGRALVYVWHPDGRFFNARLAAEGYAQQLTVPPNVQYAELFSQLVREARDNGRGLWAGCSTAAEARSAPSQVADRDCGEFGSQAEAQSFYEEQGGPAQDPHNLDADNDGLACEASAPAPPPQQQAPATEQ